MTEKIIRHHERRNMRLHFLDTLHRKGYILHDESGIVCRETVASDGTYTGRFVIYQSRADFAVPVYGATLSEAWGIFLSAVEMAE